MLKKFRFVKKEYTNNRNLEYSLWHRQLPFFCYAMDLDWIEWRNNRGIVALIETKKSGYLSDFQRKVYLELADKINVPVYFVKYNNLDCFEVLDLKTNEKRILNELEYKEFIQSL